MVVTHLLKMCNTTLRPNFGSKWAIWNKWLVPAYILARYSPGSAGSFLHLGGGVCFIFFVHTSLSSVIQKKKKKKKNTDFV